MVYRVQDIPIAVKRLRERKIFITTGRNRGSSMVFFTIELAIKSPQARSAEDGSVRSILEKEKSTVRSFEQQQVQQRYKWLWKSVCRSVRATSINFYSSLLPFLLSSSLHLASFIETLYSSATINLSSRIRKFLFSSINLPVISRWQRSHNEILSSYRSVDAGMAETRANNALASREFQTKQPA